MTQRTVQDERVALEELSGLVSLTELTSSTDPRAAYAALQAHWGPVASAEIERKDDQVVPA